MKEKRINHNRKTQKNKMPSCYQPSPLEDENHHVAIPWKMSQGQLG
jgi:hypothetical protein